MAQVKVLRLDASKLKKQLWDAGLVTLTLLIGLSGSGLVYRALDTIVALQQRERLGVAGQPVINAFSAELNRTMETVRGTGLMMASQKNLGQREFLAYSHRVMAEVHALTFLQWQPVIPEDRPATFDVVVRAKDRPPLRAEGPESTDFIAGRPPAELLPVLFSWPENTNASGIELNRERSHRLSRNQARDTGLLVASAVLHSIDKDVHAAEKQSLSIFAAVYGDGPLSTVEQRRQHLIGYAAGVIQVSTILREAASRADAALLDMNVFDLANGTRTLIYSSGATAGESHHPAGEQDLVLPVEVGTRPWEIVLQPQPGFFANEAKNEAFIALMTGLCATFLLSFALHRLQRSRRRIEAQQATTLMENSILAGECQRLNHVLHTGLTQHGEEIIDLQRLDHDDSYTDMAFAVKSSGIGIPPDPLQSIVEDSGQAEASIPHHVGGPSVELAISQRLVTQMGEHLNVDSTSGPGNRADFTQRFNSDQTIDTEEPHPVLPQISTGGLFHTLVVDDNPTAREMLQTMIQSLGWQCESANSGEEALALIQYREANHAPYDVIFMDWLMPDMDGEETILHLRERQFAKQTPVIIMVTAHDREILSEKMHDEHTALDGFLVKPVTTSMLFDAVIDATAGQAGQATSSKNHQDPAQRPEMRLQVVEDKVLNQLVARDVLTQEGALFDVASNGAESLECTQAVQPPSAAILMDMHMTDMDGDKITQQAEQSSAETILSGQCSLTHGLAELEALLQSADMRATTAFSELWWQIEDPSLPELTLLQIAIDKLDFQHAQDICRQLHAKLG